MAGIIKAGGAAPAGGDVQSVAFQFDDITGKADDYLGAVQRHAAEIVAAAKRDAKQIRQHAVEEGRQAARQAAEQAVNQQLKRRLESLTPAIDQAVNGVIQSKQGWLAYWEQNAVHLACAIAERVVRRELRRTPEIPLELIREALQLAAGSGGITLRLNPRDHEVLGEQAAQLVERLATLGPARIVADPEISPGGCRVDTEYGSIDQQIQSQLERIEEELA